MHSYVTQTFLHCFLCNYWEVLRKFFTLITDICLCTEFLSYVHNGFITWAPGHKNTVSLSATIITADDSLPGLSKDSRHCFFDWENSVLKIYKYYTQSNCIFECNLFYVQDQLNQTCTPWYFPTPEDLPTICDPWQAVQIIEAMSNVPHDQCFHCLPDCESTILKARISTSQLRRCKMSNLGRNLFCTKNENTKLTKQFLDELLEPNYKIRFSTLPYFFNNNYTLPVRNLVPML